MQDALPCFQQGSKLAHIYSRAITTQTVAMEWLMSCKSTLIYLVATCSCSCLLSMKWDTMFHFPILDIYGDKQRFACVGYHNRNNSNNINIITTMKVLGASVF